MLKNDVRYIIRRVIVAVLIAFIFFFLRTSGVLAATVTVSNNQFQYSRHTCSLNELNCTDFYTSGYSNFGTWLNFPSQNPTGVGGPWIYFIASYYKANATLTTGNVYTVIFRTQFNPKEEVLNHINSIQYNIYGYVNNAYSDTYISTQSCSTRNVVTHDYAIETTCVFQVNTNATGFLIRSVYSNTKTTGSITMSNAQASSSQNEIGAINELTNVIKQQFSVFINAITIQNDRLYEDQTDDSDPSIDVSGMSNITGIFPPGPVDSLLALPLNIINIFIDSANGTCSPYTFTFIFDEQMSIPCFNMFWDEVPTSLMLFLSDLPAVLIFIKWAKSVYKRVERATMFESSVDDEWGGI